MAKTKESTKEKEVKKTKKALDTSKEVTIASEIKDNKIIVTKSRKNEETEDHSMVNKLYALYQLQQNDTKINKLRSQRGMLPIEVKDLEDTVEGLKTRISKFKEEVKGIEDFITGKNIEIKEAQAAIKKYEAQKENVKNNREYESLTNQIENQVLDIKLHEKDIKIAKDKLAIKQNSLELVEKDLILYTTELEIKERELDEIIAETKKEEMTLIEESKKHEQYIDERLLIAYKRIRKNAKNGLAVVTVERESCGGCFNKIPPQRQLDIKTLKKIIVCEYCGRILVDISMFNTTKN